MIFGFSSTAAIFLEFWKRYAAEIKHSWDLSNYDTYEEHPRPEYLVRLKNVQKKLNPITDTPEPYVPFWKMRLPYTMFSVSMILFLVRIIINSPCDCQSVGVLCVLQWLISNFLMQICMAVAAVVAVVVYRLALVLVLVSSGNDELIHSWGLIIVNSTAASINLVFIFFFNWVIY